MEAVPLQVSSNPVSPSSFPQAGAVRGLAPTLSVRDMLLRIALSSSGQRSARRVKFMGGVAAAGARIRATSAMILRL